VQEIDVIGNIAESNIRFMLNTTLWNSFDSDVLSNEEIPNQKIRDSVKAFAI
jgi:hypothetical protein